MWLTVPALVAACEFQHGTLGGGNSRSDGGGMNIDIDAPLADAAVDAPPGQTCVGGSQGSLLRVCYAPGTEPTNPYNPTTNYDTGSGCDRVIGQSFPYPELCIKHGSSITITNNIRYTGLRPIVLVSLSTIMISGDVDVSNGGAGGTNLVCAFDLEGQNDNNNGSSSGAGGGAGGGFGTSGGSGGDGTVSGGPFGPSIGLGAIRGGCPGGRGGNSTIGNGGSGGDGGGAIYLIAKDSINVTGSIRANGEHGNGGGLKAGGGGGGSGGLVGFDAPAVSVGGTVMANGGGGGEGGDTNETGMPGSDPQIATYNQRAAGGTGMADNGGAGGGGSVLTMSGVTGGSSGNGGGGGGGGGGRVRRYGGTGLTGKISPPVP